MTCLLEFLPLQSRDSSLPLLRIHLLELFDSKLFNVAFYELNALHVIRHVRSVSFKANHVQCGCRLKRAVKMEVFARVLGLVQIRGESSVKDGLRLQEIGVYST